MRRFLQYFSIIIFIDNIFNQTGVSQIHVIFYIYLEIYILLAVNSHNLMSPSNRFYSINIIPISLKKKLNNSTGLLEKRL